MEDSSFGFGYMNPQLYLACFSARSYTMQNFSTTPCWTGKIYSSFCQILSGRVEFQLNDRTLSGTAGDIFYMPEGAQYCSRWTGSPEIKFIGTYSRFFATNEIGTLYNGQTSVVPLDRQFAFQKIEDLGQFRALDDMSDILQNYYKGTEGQLLALSRFYRLMARAFPLLERQKVHPIIAAIMPAVSYLERNFMKNDPIPVLAGLCHLSESRFYHLFQQSMNCTPVEFRNQLRAGYARQLLSGSELSLEEIGAQLGFESQEYFRRIFKRYNGLSPSQYRKSKETDVSI